MIYINSKEKINNLNNNYYVIIDFDKTITTLNSYTTFSLFAYSNLYPKEYLEEYNRLASIFYPLELNPYLSLEEKKKVAKKWHIASYNLMVKYQVKESDIDNIIDSSICPNMRDGSIDLFNYLNDNNIPVIICSAGIQNFIIKILDKYHCNYDNIYVHSNRLEFENNIIVPQQSEMINSSVKHHIKLPNSFFNTIKQKELSIIIGDQLNDLKMNKYLPNNNSLSFGFLESNVKDNQKPFFDNYDVILTDNESFKPIQKILTKKEH